MSLPDGWSRAVDPGTSLPYYHNARRGVTSWDAPGAPRGSAELMSAIARSKVLAEFEHPSSKRGRPNGVGKVRDVHGGDPPGRGGGDPPGRGGGDPPGRGGRMPGDPHGGEQSSPSTAPRKRTETTEDDETGDPKRNKGAELAEALATSIHSESIVSLRERRWP